jgi:peptide/nickel transport system substrate-binding protein
MGEREHPLIGGLKAHFAEGRIGRREFLRSATLLGLSATAAYAFAAKVSGEPLVKQANAAMPKGGRLRLGMRVLDVSDPHTFDWAEKSNIGRQVCEYLTKTGHDNVTRPYLLEKWEASDDLRTWTLHLRQDVKWRNGRDFVADDAIWNLKRVLDPATGSSVMGLMKGYMLNEVEADGEKTAELWDANAIEKLDDHTIRLNTKQPQLAVPEHLFHYPLLIIDPEEGGKFGPGANGTGPFELVEHELGNRSLFKAREDYWGEGPHLDELLFVDLGDDASASMAAMASKQIDGLFMADVTQLATLRKLPDLEFYEAQTADTGIVRGKFDTAPFDDARVRQALRYAVDQKKTLEISLQGIGVPAEHHHVSQIHPEYAELPPFERDVEKAKSLLAEAGYPDGVDLELAVPADQQWQSVAAQALAEQWKEAGIRVTLNVMPGAQYWDIWDKVPFGFTRWVHRPLGVMTLGLAYRSGVPWNESSYSNAEFDDLLNKAEGILDPDERRKVMDDLERILQEDGPIVQPFWRSIFTFHHKKVKGFRMHPTTYVFGNELAMEEA